MSSDSFTTPLRDCSGTLERFKFRTCSAAYPSYSCSPVYMNPEQEIELVLRVLSTRPTDEEIFHLEHEDVNPRKVEQEPEEEPEKEPEEKPEEEPVPLPVP